LNYYKITVIKEAVNNDTLNSTKAESNRHVKNICTEHHWPPVRNIGLHMHISLAYQVTYVTVVYLRHVDNNELVQYKTCISQMRIEGDTCS
jgi:hypothetical protein